MSFDNKTEKPTPRRRQKAREKGQVARSRELAGTAGMLAALLVIANGVREVVPRWGGMFREWLLMADPRTDQAQSMVALPLMETLRWAALPMLAAWGIAAGAMFAQGGFVFAPEALSPTLSRLSPAGKLRQLFSIQALIGALKSIVPVIGTGYLCFEILDRDWEQVVHAPRGGRSALMGFFASRTYEIAWKGGLVLIAWSFVDYLMQRQKLEGDLRMTKKELRDEYKETEGNPTSKTRMRRMQRQVKRRRMLQEVERATVVVTNPTHFAVALRYDGDLPAPVVLAKGRDLFAQQIKEVARWQGIAVMENPPLAQALYRTVEVGQAIPSKLYSAVAELLAFVFRAQAMAARQTSTRAAEGGIANA
jgi:flagellar biosynthesis protein FlhB